MIMDGYTTVLFVYRWWLIAKMLIYQWFLIIFGGEIGDFGKVKSVKNPVISMVLR
jgi:hypothetical protein